MRRRPPRSTRTDTLFPYTTLFRSPNPATALGELWTIGTGSVGTAALYFLTLFTRRFDAGLIDKDDVEIENLDRSPIFVATDDGRPKVHATADYLRSVGVASVRPERATLGESKLWRTRQRPEESRVGKECVSTCRYRW